MILMFCIHRQVFYAAAVPPSCSAGTKSCFSGLDGEHLQRSAATTIFLRRHGAECEPAACTFPARFLVSLYGAAA
jgi:hypothetical protein